MGSDNNRTRYIYTLHQSDKPEGSPYESGIFHLDIEFGAVRFFSSYRTNVDVPLQTTKIKVLDEDIPLQRQLPRLHMSRHPERSVVPCTDCLQDLVVDFVTFD